MTKIVHKINVEWGIEHLVWQRNDSRFNRLFPFVTIFNVRLIININGNFGRYQSSTPPNPATAVTATAAITTITTAMIVVPVADTRHMTTALAPTFFSMAEVRVLGLLWEHRWPFPAQILSYFSVNTIEDEKDASTSHLARLAN